MTRVTIREFFMEHAGMRFAMTCDAPENNLVRSLVTIYTVQPAMFCLASCKHGHLFPMTASAKFRRDFSVKSQAGWPVRLMAPETVTVPHVVTVGIMAFRALHELSVNLVTTVAVLFSMGAGILFHLLPWPRVTCETRGLYILHTGNIKICQCMGIVAFRTVFNGKMPLFLLQVTLVA
jgi:hypothetical protein